MGCDTPTFAKIVGKSFVNPLACRWSIGLLEIIWLVGKSCSGIVAVMNMLEDGTLHTIQVNIDLHER